MKKIFTLVVVALSAISANAQTESWNVNNTDGTLKAEYVANKDATAMLREPAVIFVSSIGMNAFFEYVELSVVVSFASTFTPSPSAQSVGGFE